MEVILGRMVSPWMLVMMVRLVWQNKQLATASFTEIQFWTQTWRIYLVGLQDANGVDVLDLRFWLEGL